MDGFCSSCYILQYLVSPSSYWDSCAVRILITADIFAGLNLSPSSYSVDRVVSSSRRSRVLKNARSVFGGRAKINQKTRRMTPKLHLDRGKSSHVMENPFLWRNPNDFRSNESRFCKRLSISSSNRIRTGSARNLGT